MPTPGAPVNPGDPPFGFGEPPGCCPSLNKVPTVIAGLSGGADGTVSGLAVTGDAGCSPHGYPCLGASYAIYGEETGAPGGIINAVVTINVTCADTSCRCGGIDPDFFPVCGFVMIFMDCVLIASVNIPTAVGTYVYNVVANGSTGTGSIT